MKNYVPVLVKGDVNKLWIHRFGASINHLDSREGKVGKTNDHEGGGDQNTQKSFHVVYG